MAIDGCRIETGETFAIDRNRVKNDKIYDVDGKTVEQHYAFEQERPRGGRWDNGLDPRRHS